MPQYILREFKVTDARVSVGTDWQQGWNPDRATRFPGDWNMASLAGSRSKGPGAGIRMGVGRKVSGLIRHSYHQVGGGEDRVSVLTPWCPRWSMCHPLTRACGPRAPVPRSERGAPWKPQPVEGRVSGLQGELGGVAVLGGGGWSRAVERVQLGGGGRWWEWAPWAGGQESGAGGVTRHRRSGWGVGRGY